MIYSLSEGMKRVDVPENHAKNNLAIGTVLHLNGYNDPDYVIVKNLGINERFSGYGCTYLCVSLLDFGQHRKEAFNLKHISEKQDNRIQVYITDQIKSPDETLDIWEKSEEKRKRFEENQAKMKAE